MGRKHKEISFYKDLRGCWICTSHSKKGKGYPVISRGGKSIMMSKHIYEENYGKVPVGKEVMHKCDNPSCINPLHLIVGTHKENMVDASRKNRMCSGEKHKDCKLTEEQVKEILRNSGGRPRELGRKYGVAHTTIVRIKQRKYWKHINV